MTVVAHGIYTYADSFAPFVYDIVAHLKRYDPVIFTYGLGVHEVYTRFPVYAPNALDAFGASSNPRRFRRLTRAVSMVLNYAGLRDRVMHSLQQRGGDVLAQAVQKHRVQLLHAHFGPTGLSFLPICQELRLPLIVSTYGYDVSSRPLRDGAYAQSLQTMFHYATIVLAMSQDMRSDLIALGCPDDKIVIYHTSVDIDNFAFRSSRHGSPGIRILTVCNYVEKKGLPYLIQAFAQVRKQFSNVELRIVGRPAEDNDITREVDRFVETFNLHESVTQQLFVPHGRILEEMAQADIFALPSVTAQNGDKEGVPTVLLEAQSSGLPVVSTWHAGIPEAVVDGETGFLVEERDVEDLAAKLALLVSSEELRERMGKIGREHIEREFNIQTQTEKLERIYDRVINNRRVIERY